MCSSCRRRNPLKSPLGKIVQGLIDDVHELTSAVAKLETTAVQLGKLYLDVNDHDEHQIVQLQPVSTDDFVLDLLDP